MHTYAGYENKVRPNLHSRVRSMNVEERIFEIVIPMEDVIEFKGGRKVVVQKKVFPGYLLVRMSLDDDSWYVVRNTPGVTGFVGERRQANAALAQGSRVHPRRRQARGPGRREEGPAALRVRRGEQVRVRHRPVRRLQRRDQRDRRRPVEAQGARQHLRPGDPGRARVRPGRQALAGPAVRMPRERTAEATERTVISQRAEAKQ